MVHWDLINCGDTEVSPRKTDDRRALGRRTIADFGEQWSRYPDFKGHLGSIELLDDTLAPLLDVRAIAGSRVAEIGSGTGRVVHALGEIGASHITAVEPSESFAVLKRNTVQFQPRITYLQLTGDLLPASRDLDYVLCLGVLHHIPDPAPVVRAAFASLRPGGRLFVWVYGREGNRLYLLFARPLRLLTRWMPHELLATLAWIIYLPIPIYMKACAILPLPLHDYVRSVLVRLSPRHRRLTIYDQLRPAYAKYYTEREARGLLEHAGFVNVRTHHRHAYSWSVIGTRPA